MSPKEVYLDVSRAVDFYEGEVVVDCVAGFVLVGVAHQVGVDGLRVGHVQAHRYGHVLAVAVGRIANGQPLGLDHLDETYRNKNVKEIHFLRLLITLRLSQ